MKFREYIMRIEPDSKKLYQHKISLLEIESAIKEQNKDYGIKLDF